MLIFHSHLLYRNILLLLWFTFFATQLYRAVSMVSLLVLRTEVAVANCRIPPFVCLFSLDSLHRKCLVSIHFLLHTSYFMLFYKFCTTGFLCFGVLCNFTSLRSSKRSGPYCTSGFLSLSLFFYLQLCTY